MVQHNYLCSLFPVNMQCVEMLLTRIAVCLQCSWSPRRILLINDHYLLNVTCMDVI